MSAKDFLLYNDVVIIGAGFSGINMGCQLQRQLGVTDYVIYDRARELGGAWQANKCKSTRFETTISHKFPNRNRPRVWCRHSWSPILPFLVSVPSV